MSTARAEPWDCMFAFFRDLGFGLARLVLEVFGIAFRRGRGFSLAEIRILEATKKKLRAPIFFFV